MFYDFECYSLNKDNAEDCLINSKLWSLLLFYWKRQFLICRLDLQGRVCNRYITLIVQICSLIEKFISSLFVKRFLWCKLLQSSFTRNEVSTIYLCVYLYTVYIYNIFNLWQNLVILYVVWGLASFEGLASFLLRCLVISDNLRQGCPILLLAIDCPAKFSSNSNQTHLKQLIKVFRIAWKLKAGVFD